MKRVALSAIAALCVGICAHAWAAEDLNGFRKASGSDISFALGGAYSNATLTIVGPDGKIYRSFSKAGNPAINLIREKALADGQYKYEITAASSQQTTIANPIDNGRGERDKGTMRVGVSATGAFMAKGGLIVEMDEQEEKR